MEERSVVASKEAGLGFAEKDVQLLAFLAFVFGSKKIRIVLGGPENRVGPGPEQRCSIARGTVKTLTFLPSKLLFVAAKGGACTSSIWLRLDEDSL